MKKPVSFNISVTPIHSTYWPANLILQGHYLLAWPPTPPADHFHDHITSLPRSLNVQIPLKLAFSFPLQIMILLALLYSSLSSSCTPPLC